MTSAARVMKHPLHPILVVYPIGLWTFSLVCDVVYLLHWGGEDWASAALYTLGGGIVGALLAAIPGLIDLMALTDPTVRRIGVFHMVINLAAVAVFAVDFGVRLHRGAGEHPPILISIGGIALIAVSGWLSGELVYVHGVAVEPRARPDV